MTAETAIAPGPSPPAGTHPHALTVRRPQSCPLIGRERELEALSRLASSPPGVGIVLGDSGMGKTRLIDELLDQPGLRGHRILVGRCRSGGRAVPLQPVIDALAAVTSLPAPALLSPASAVLRPLLPQLRHQMPADPISAPAGAGDHLRLRALLEVLAQLGPTICVLEDLDRCDERTAELLRPLVADLPANLVLLTSRAIAGVSWSSPLRGMASGAGADVRVEQVTVTPLTVGQVGRMAEALGRPHDVSAAFGSVLWERTGGVPAAVVELLRSVADHPEVLRSSESSARLHLRAAGVPTTLRHGVLRELARVTDPARLVARAAAVLGVPSDQATLGLVGGLSAPASRLALVEAIEAGLLAERDRGTYSCRSPLSAEAVHDAIPPAERRRLHRRAAEAVETIPTRPVRRLARHYHEAGLSTRWAECAAHAAREAGSSGDAVAGLELLRDLLDHRRLPGRHRAELALAATGVALRDRQLRPQVVELLRSLVHAGGLTPAARGEVLWLLGTTLLDGGDAAGWRQSLTLAAAALVSAPSRVALVMCELAMPWGGLEDPAGRRRWLDSATEIASRQRDRTVSLKVRVASALLSLHEGERGALRAVERLPWGAASPESRRVLAWGAANLCTVCLHTGRYQRARVASEDALRRMNLLDGGDSPSDAAEAAALELAWSTGEWSGLDGRVRAFLGVPGRTPGHALRGHLVLGRLLLVRGDVEAACRHLRTASETALAAGVIPDVISTAGWLAVALLARGDTCAASVEAGRGMELPALHRTWAWAGPAAPPAVEALIACHRLPDARRLVALMVGDLQGRDLPLPWAASRYCAGLVSEAEGDRVGAAAAFREAGALYRTLPHPYSAAGAIARAGWNLLAEGNTAGSDLLLEALTLFEGLGATVDAGRVRRALRRRSVDVPRRTGRGRPAYGPLLSPREAQVVALAAEGRTNEEVGGQLFISARTAEHHLSAAMRKLGIASRRHLPSVAGHTFPGK